MLWWLAQNTVTAAVLACMVAMLCRWGRFRPAVCHALWLVVLLKLLTPPLIVWPWALPGLLASEDPAVQASEPSIEVVSATSRRDAQAPLDASPRDAAFQVANGPRRLEEPGLAIRPETGPSLRASSVSSTLLYVWLMGTAFVGLSRALRIIRFRALLARGKRAARCLVREVDELSGRLQVKPPLTRLVAQISSPFVWGLGRAKLMWPALLMSSLPARCRPGVIVHELAHLRRRDHWVSWLEIVAESLWWWNPLYWYVRRQLRLNAELACDAWVIDALPEDRRAYAEALIEVTQHLSQTAAPAPALGMNGSARQVFERRLTMIMSNRIPHRVPRLGLMAIGLLGLLTIPGWSQNGPQPKKADNQPAKDAKVEWIVELAELAEFQAQEKLSPDPVQKPRKALQRQNAVSTAENLLLELQAITETRSANDDDREKRLQALEQKIQVLLKEVRLLRQARTAAPQKAVPEIALRSGISTVRTAPVQVVPFAVKYRQVQPVVTLARTSYNLPHDKAEILAAFLRDHVKAKVMETKVEGDTLTITTTPETQKALDALMGLVQGKPTAAKDDPNATRKAAAEALDRQAQALEYRRYRMKLRDIQESEQKPDKPKK